MTVQERIEADTRYRLRVEDFLLLDRSGAFEAYPRAELIEGEIWVVNAIHSRHARLQAEMQGRVWLALRSTGDTLRAFDAPSLRLSDGAMPQPDIVVAEPHEAGFMPGEKVRLAIEVADTTLDADLGRKLMIYARSNIPEYWVVDADARVIHQLWAPSGDSYLERREVPFGATLASRAIVKLVVETDGL